jgi:protein O-mannosyl-transferase
MKPPAGAKRTGPNAGSRPSFARMLASNRKQLLALGAILAVTFLCYLPALTGEFVNWDDYGYVVDNTLIRGFSAENALSIFTKPEQMGNYHPLTMLTYNLEYQFFGQNPHGYHVTNILLHLINTALVFWLLTLVSQRSVAIIVALLFGVHTLHVESVAWVSERKDLLYALFYFLALISYVKYVQSGGSRKMYAAALILFVLSVLSKAMAVSLVLVLPLVDYFQGRVFEKKIILEKAPFVVIAIVFGVVALYAQQSAKAIHGFAQNSFLDKLVYACYGLVMYLVKLVIPTHLSAFYPYPEKIGNVLPGRMWLYPLLVVAIAAATYYTMRRTRKVFFGMAFFLVTVALVLQVLQVGGAVMADRYTYIPSIGIFYLAAEGFNRLRDNRRLRLALTAMLTLYFGWLCVLTWGRAGIWHDSLILWTDVVGKYERIPFAFANRGYGYYKLGRYDEAVGDYNKTLELDPSDASTYHNRGVSYYRLRQYDLALADYNKALELKLDNGEVYNNRGAAFAALGRSDEAIADFTKAIALTPDYAEAYNNRGTEYAKARMFTAAIADFDKAIQLNPQYSDAVRNKELAARDMRGAQGAVGAPRTEPDAEFYLNRGLQSGRTGHAADAIKDFDTAIQLRPTYAQAYNNRGIANAMLLNYTASFADFARAIQLQPDYAEAYFNRGVAHRNKGEMDDACADFSKAAAMNYEAARLAYQTSCR